MAHDDAPEVVDADETADTSEGPAVDSECEEGGDEEWAEAEEEWEDAEEELDSRSLDDGTFTRLSNGGIFVKQFFCSAHASFLMLCRGNFR